MIPQMNDKSKRLVDMMGGYEHVVESAINSIIAAMPEEARYKANEKRDEIREIYNEVLPPVLDDMSENIPEKVIDDVCEFNKTESGQWYVHNWPAQMNIMMCGISSRMQSMMDRIEKIFE